MSRPVEVRDTRGRRALLSVLQSMPAAALARQTGYARSAICQWKNMQRTPDAAARLELARVLGIDPPMWDEPASSGATVNRHTCEHGPVQTRGVRRKTA